MKQRKTILSIALIALSSLAGSAMAQVPPQIGTFAIINNNAGKCVDISRTSTFPFTPTVQLWSCNWNRNGQLALNQIFRWRGVGKDGEGDWDTFVFQEMGGLCLSVNGDSTANAARVIATTCDYTNTSQMWIRTRKYDSSHDYTATTKWLNVRSGKCLDTWSTANGTGFQQYDCASGSWGPQDFSAMGANP